MMNKKHYLLILTLISWLMMPSGLAATFSLTPQGNLPTNIPAFGKTAAFYTLTNLSSHTLNANFIQSLPTNVSQDTCNPAYCGKTFELGPSGSNTASCRLKLIIKGPVSTPANLIICTVNGICEAVGTGLNVTLGPSLPFKGIAAGNYFNQQGDILPLLATSHNNGAAWHYPTSIFQNLQNVIDPRFSSGILSGASCTGSQNKAICIAPGQWCIGSFCDHPLPLIAVGKGNDTWVYPKSVFENLQTSVDPAIIGGYLRSGSCFGAGTSSTCIAAGTYQTSTSFLPLVALSANAGSDWTYPSSIHKNLTVIDPSFTNGTLVAASCNKQTCGNICVVAGNYCLTQMCNDQFPLLAFSTDKGKTWTYPASVNQNFTATIDPTLQGGALVGTSCTGKGAQAICVAAGNYFNAKAINPLLALTKDGGNTWIYPTDIFTDLPTRIGHRFVGGVFTSASCSGNTKPICIAAGTYFTTATHIPLLAQSRDGGSSWTYPDFIYTKLKTLVDPNFKNGLFESASCIGNGAKAICMAAGFYCTTAHCYPLMAVSKNAGKTWSYPSSIYQNLENKIDPNFNFGSFTNIHCSGIPEHHFCVAAGLYANTTTTFPLIAYSTDGGDNWTYPTDIFQNLTSRIDPGFSFGSFSSAATTGGELKFNKLNFRIKQKVQQDLKYLGLNEKLINQLLK